jgi:prophage tail gpP-like protein
MPNPAEVARLQVEGRYFEDWDTVWVQHRWQDGWPLFRFSCTESGKIPDAWELMQFKPGSRCTVFLGGILAITGIVLQRQATYDAKSHGVLISGVGQQWASSTSSVNSENKNFDGKTLKEIAEKLLSDVGGKLKVHGTLNELPFYSANVTPGELVFDVLDKFARQRGASIGTDHLGNTLLIGEHTGEVQQQLIEGKNILKMQCVFSNEQISSLYRVTAQKGSFDETISKMREATEMAADVKGTLKNAFKYLETPIEHPVQSLDEVKLSAYYKAVHAEGTQVRAYVTVQGWLRDGKILWRTGDNVIVVSPMAMLNMVMKVQNATFSQDDRSGTTTVLECVLPWMLGDKLYATDRPPPPPATTSSNGPAVINPASVTSA